MIEIDGVRRVLEDPVSESGDYISDVYRDAIDYSTAPGPLASDEKERLASSLRSLNRNLATTSFFLFGTECAEVYNDVITQLNEINQSDPDLDTLQPLMNYVDARRQWSSQFKFGN